MKKKLFMIILSAITAFSFTACNKSDVKVSFDSEKPWPNKETCTYSVERIYTPSKGADVSVAKGTYTSEIITGNDSSTVTNTFELTYESSDVEETTTLSETSQLMKNAGLTDRYVGSATFYKDSLVPISAYKNHSVAQRPLTDSDMPTPQENPEEGVLFRYVLSSSPKYADPRGYSYEADYLKNTVKFKTTEGKTNKSELGGSTVYLRDYSSVEKEYGISSGTRFDNEQLAHVVRALSDTRRKGSATFYLTNFYDSYINGGYVRHTMSLSCADKNTNVELSLDPDKFTIADEDVPIELNNNGKYTVACVNATVSLNASNPGPSINFKVIAPDITVKRNDSAASTSPARKLVVQMTFTEYSLYSASAAYKTVYTLVDYSAT